MDQCTPTLPPHALRLAKAFHAGSVWAGATFDDEAVSGFLGGMLANENAYLHVTDTGIIGGLVMPMWFAPSLVLGVEMFWYSERSGEGPELRRGFEDWARSRGAEVLQFSAMANDREPALRRLYRAAGYEVCEIGFRKVA